MTRPDPLRLAALLGARDALFRAAADLERPGVLRELAGLASLVDRLTLERVAGWLRRRGRALDDAAVTTAGEDGAPVLAALEAARPVTPPAYCPACPHRGTLEG